MERAELQGKVKSMLETMKPMDREILALIHYEGRSTREAALELGIEMEAAWKRYNRALDRLSNLMNRM